MIQKPEKGLARFVPAWGWMRRYERKTLSNDVIAGLITAIILVPQSMAYALLANLPPHAGLYTALLAPLIYAFLGTSMTLAAGPVAVVSIMTAGIVGSLQLTDPGQQMAAASLLALLSAGILLLMYVLRLGFMVNFLSHPVLSGFTSAAAILISISQLRHLLGIDIPRGEAIETVQRLVEKSLELHGPTAVIGLCALLLLYLFKAKAATWLQKAGVPASWAVPLARTGPLWVVVFTTLPVIVFDLSQHGVATVGAIPEGLPTVKAPPFDWSMIEQILTGAVLVALIGFMETVSVAKALGSKRRQKIDADQELLAFSVANAGSAMTGGYPVAGGFGRSALNFAAGAVTPMASLVTGLLMAFALLFLTPLFHALPKATLAAIILIAVSQLIDWHALKHALRYNPADAMSLIATFGLVLVIGVELGLLIGVFLSIAIYLYRSARPHIAIVGRVPGSEHYRNVLRHTVETDPKILAVRVDESLYFANTRYLEDRLPAEIADRPEVNHMVLICSAINAIDASALESLENLVLNLRAAEVTVHLSEVKGPVMDRLERSNFLEILQPGQIFLHTHQAMEALGASFCARQ